jgi:hypothetical protein
MFITKLPQCSYISLPVAFIKINCQQPTAVISQERIYANDDFAAEMGFDDLVVESQIVFVMTILTSNRRLWADSGFPLVLTSRRVTWFPALSIFKSPSINILATSENRAKQSNFLCKVTFFSDNFRVRLMNG